VLIGIQINIHQMPISSGCRRRSWLKKVGELINTF